MLAVIRCAIDSNSEDHAWHLTDNSTEIAEYPGSDIIVGESREDLLGRLRERYPAEDGYQRIWEERDHIHCLCRGRLQNSPESIEIAKSKARLGERVDLGDAGWSVYNQVSHYGDGNQSAVFDGFVLEHGEGMFLVYDPSRYLSIKTACEAREAKKKKNIGKRTEWSITKSVRRGQISCWTLGSFLDSLRRKIVRSKALEGVVDPCSKMWLHECRPVRLNRIRNMFRLLSLLELVSGKKRDYAHTDIQYYVKALPRLLDEAEVALPVMKKAIKDFDKDWKKFSFVSGAKFNESNRKEALEARRLMSKFARWLEQELKKMV